MFPGLTGTNRSDTLLELICGILVYGTIGQLAVVCFFYDKVSISIGWWIGILCAALSAYHIWWGLDRALDFGEKDAAKLITSYNMLRYAVVIVIMGVIMVSEIGNPLAAVFGMFGLKAGAYMQSLIGKLHKNAGQPDCATLEVLLKETGDKEMNV